MSTATRTLRLSLAHALPVVIDVMPSSTEALGAHYAVMTSRNFITGHPKTGRPTWTDTATGYHFGGWGSVHR
jgi:hypothetical protein